MTRLSARALLREFVCDVVIFLYKIGESLLDATIRPYVITAVCNDMYSSVNDGDGGDGSVSDPWSISQRVARDDSVIISKTTYNDSESICMNLENLPGVEAEIQRHAAGVLVAHRVLVNIPAVILGLFCGAWSDTRGRKLPMMAPSLGTCLAVLLYLGSMHVDHLRVVLLLTGAAVQGIFGKTSVIAMAVNSHVADTSDTEQRTKRLGRVLASSFLGMFLGSLMAGVLQDVSTLLTTLTVVSACHALCVLTVLLGVTETVGDCASDEDMTFVESRSGASKRAKAVAAAATVPGEGDEEEEGEEQGKKKRHALFSWAGLKESVMTVAKPREGNKRSVIVISLIGLTLNQCLKVGDQDITVLFVQEPPLSWPSSRYGYLIATDYGTMGLALLFILPLLSDVLRLSDISIVMLAMLFKLIRSIWAGFCTETWMMFTSVVSGALGGLINPGLRSVLSKTASNGEVGKLFSIQASLETLSKLVGSSVFTGIYAATVNVLPAAAYLSEAAAYLGVLVLMLCLGQMVKEDGALGLLLTFARPYNALTGPAPADDQSEDRVKAKNLFPLGAATP